MITQNAVLYTDLIYKRHQENIDKAKQNNDILESSDQIQSPLSLLSTLDELDQVSQLISCNVCYLTISHKFNLINLHPIGLIN